MTINELDCVACLSASVAKLRSAYEGRTTTLGTPKLERTAAVLVSPYVDTDATGRTQLESGLGDP